MSLSFAKSGHRRLRRRLRHRRHLRRRRLRRRLRRRRRRRHLRLGWSACTEGQGFKVNPASEILRHYLLAPFSDFELRILHF